MGAAIYTRISRSDDDDHTAVDRQEADCRKMLKRLGHEQPLVFCDNGISAWKASASRPGWKALLAAIEAGDIDTLAVWHPDRLFRLPRDLETLLELSDRKNVLLVSVGGDLDLTSAESRFMLRLQIAHACKSSDDTSRRLKRKFEQNAREGLPHGGPRGFGIASGQRALVEEEAAAIREVAQRLLAGETLYSVTKWLNDNGYQPTGGSGRWCSTTVRQMLKRPSLAGFRRYQGVVVGKTLHPPILDEDTWAAIQTLLGDPSRRTSTHTARTHVLSGILRCGQCGTGLRRLALALPRYTCQSCFGTSIVQAKTDLYVTEAVKERIRSLKLRAPSKSRPSDTGVGAQILALRARQAQIAEEFADDPDVTPEQLRAMSRRIRARIEELETVQAQQLEQRVTEAITPDLADKFETLDIGRRQAVIRALTDDITVLRGRLGGGFDPGRISISWR